MDQDADAALGATGTLRARNCGVLSKIIMDFTYEQATLTADGGLSIDILKPGPLVYELFTGFAKKVVQCMNVDNLESESVRFCLLEFLLELDNCRLQIFCVEQLTDSITTHHRFKGF